MPEHLNRERIAALLDGPEARGTDGEHLERCEECMHEYEQMARIRMALSALPDLEPPEGEWDRIRDRLGAEVSGKVVRMDSARPVPAWVRPGPMWAAAVIGLFVAGLGVGRQLALHESAASSEPAAELAARAAEAEAPDHDETDTAAYLRTVAQMERLRREGATDPALWNDPSAATERLMKLDALIQASREALSAAPTDPALNDFLFEVVDERESLAGQLDRSLRLTSVEY
jgi:hypothetical protein